MSPPMRIPAMAQPTATPARTWGFVFAGAGSDAPSIVGDAVGTPSRPGDGDCPASVGGVAADDVTADAAGTMEVAALVPLPFTAGNEV